MSAKGRLVTAVVHQEDDDGAYRTVQQWRQRGMSARLHRRVIKVDGLKIECSIVVVRATDEMEEQS